MALFDLLSGWTAWAPFTLLIVGLMGFAVGALTEKHHGFRRLLSALVLAAVIKVVGYYLAEVILFGSWLTPVASIPGNLIQVGVAAALVLPIAAPLRKAVASYV